MVRRVRCPRCLAVILADGDSVTCQACGLAGRVEAKAPVRGQAKRATGRAPSGRQRQRPQKGDPWTITLDLRNLSPSRWSPGMKAFTVLVLLAGVFLAGGVSGVVFERARSDVTDDLDGASGLFGSSKNDSTSDGGTGSTGPLDAVKNNTTDGTTDPDNVTDPDNTTDLDNATTGDPDPGPPASSTEPLQYSGSGNWESGLESLPAGLLRFTLSHSGDGFFSVKVIADGDTKPAVRVQASDAGTFTGMVRYAALDAAGGYTIAVSAQSSATWEVDIEVVGDESASSQSFTADGTADDGLGPYRFSGTMEVSFSAPQLNYNVRALTAAGLAVDGCSFVSESGTNTGSCTFSAQTKVYFDISISKDAGKWQMTATAAG